MNLFKSNQLFFLLHLAHIIAMESIAWFTIFYFGNGWIPTVITQVQAGWLQHDYGHLSVYKKSMWNHIVHKFVIGHLKVNVGHPGHPFHQLVGGHSAISLPSEQVASPVSVLAEL